jgi:hypothetical protein
METDIEPFREMVWIVIESFGLGRVFGIVPPSPETETWLLQIMSATPGDYDIAVEWKSDDRHFFVRCGYDSVFRHDNAIVLKTSAEVVAAIELIHGRNKFIRRSS